MPFQSEKQRRYLWANEPEIARDWTNTYGSGIARALGGRIGFWNGSGNIRQQPHQPRDLLVQNNPYGTRPRYQPPGGGDPGMRSAPTGGPPGGGDPGMRHTAPTPQPTHADRIVDVAQRKKRQDIRDLIAKQEAEKDYTRTGQIKPGPQLGWAGSGVGGGLGNWASQFAGSKIGGGLGSMLFGPWGALLGALFGRGVGKRGWQARQTKEKESLQDILLGQNTLLSNVFNKKKTPITGGERDFDPNARISDTSFSLNQGLGGINLGNQDYDKLKTIDTRMGMYGPRGLSLQDRRKMGTRLDVPIRSGQMDRSAWSGQEAPTMKGRTLDDVYGLYGRTPEFREFDQWEGTQAQQEDPYVRGFDLAPIPSEEDLMYGDTLWQR